MQVLNSKFEILSHIGNGSFGNVVLARMKDCDSSESSLVAIKTMKKTFQTVSDCLKLREIRSLHTLPPHPHIVLVYDSFLDPTTKKLHMVMEHMEGNLYQLIKSRNKKIFDIHTISRYQILSALKHIHDHNFFHRDIKPENILVSSISNQKLSKSLIFNNKFETHLTDDPTYIIKLADFGLAREITSQSPYTSYVSTRWYRAPEVLLRANEYSAPVDIWAFGAMAVELATFQPLFPGANEIDQIWKICEIIGSPAVWLHSNKNIEIGGGEWKKGLKLAEKLGFSFPKIPPISLETILADSWPSSFTSFIRWTMQWDPLRRPSCMQSLKHPFFNKIDNSLETLTTNTCTSTSLQPFQRKLNIDQHNCDSNKMEFQTNKALLINEKHLDSRYTPKKHLFFNLQHSLRRKEYEAIGDSKEPAPNENILNRTFPESGGNSQKLQFNNYSYPIYKIKITSSEPSEKSIAPKNVIQTSTYVFKGLSLYEENPLPAESFIVNKSESKHSNTKMEHSVFNSIGPDKESLVVNSHDKSIQYNMSFFSHLRKKIKHLNNSNFRSAYNFEPNNHQIDHIQDDMTLKTLKKSDRSLKTLNITSDRKDIKKITSIISHSSAFNKNSFTNASQNMSSYLIDQHQLTSTSIPYNAKNPKSLSSNFDILHQHSKIENKLIGNTSCLTYRSEKKKEIDTDQEIKKSKNYYHKYHPYIYDSKDKKTTRPFLTDSKKTLLLKHVSQSFHLSRLYSNFNFMHHKSICSSPKDKYSSKCENGLKKNILEKKKKLLILYQIQFKIKRS
ncbi:hypothetical protein PCANB_002190 [Pneumocystis canis]|nr:hypothetical protein PCANB_002190 [Pneumocystis canis]